MSKNIVICCDGTGNEYCVNNTNVVKLYERIVRDDKQIAFYDPGVGTFSYLGRRLGRRAGILLGKAFGAGLQENIEDAYEYLMSRFEPGDRVFLFGFSRGAFTARALAGMMNKCGLLQKGSRNLISYASRIYTTHGNDETAAGFAKTYGHRCDAHFIGVWDTVGSLGWFMGKKFFNTDLNEHVRFGYQAVAIDEKRKKFPISLWTEPPLSPSQTIKQVWFAGVHSDVGGWYRETGLSDITLIWMLENAAAQGLRLRNTWREGLNPDPCAVMHVSRKGFWRLWRPVQRTIPDGARVHNSVQERLKGVQGYNPPLPERVHWCSR